MLDLDTELLPDLDWMLQSGEASPEMLAEALIGAYHAPVYRLALSLLESPEQAAHLAREAFISALLNAYRYPSSRFGGSGRSGSHANSSATRSDGDGGGDGEDGIRAWLFSQVIDVYVKEKGREVRRQTPTPNVGIPAVLPNPAPPALNSLEMERMFHLVDRLPLSERLPLLLSAVQGSSPAEIARVLKRPEHTIRNLLKFTRRNIYEALPRPADGALPVSSFETQLAVALGARWPAPEFTTADDARLIDEVSEQARQRNTGRSRQARVKETTIIAAVIGLVLVLAWGYNLLFPEPLPTPQAANPLASAPKVVTQIVYVTSTPRRQPYPPYPEGVFYTVQAGDTLALVAARLGVAPANLAVLNRLPPGGELSPGQNLLIPGRIPPGAAPVPTFVPTPLPSPLPGDASVERVFKQFGEFSNAMHSIWLDLLYVYYGPSGYLGPTQVYRIQAWITDGRTLLLGGPAGQDPAEALLMYEHETYIAYPGQGRPWFTPARNGGELEGNRMFWLLLTALGVSDQSYPNSLLHTLAGTQSLVSGSDTLYGRPALIVDQFDRANFLSARLWYDAQTGLQTRREQYSSQAAGELIYEVQVTGLEVDVLFPAELFDPWLPWRGGYAMDYTGRPVPVDDSPVVVQVVAGRQPRQSERPPQGFDPATQPLALQFDQDLNLFSPITGTQALTAELFAGPYFMGRFSFANPLTARCQRSPDGRRLGFLQGDPSVGFPSRNPFQWFEITRPYVRHNPQPDLLVSDFAFAPDSRRVALVGSRQNERGLFVLDTTTGLVRLLVNRLDSGSSLVWSPDGNFVALIGQAGYSGESSVIVVNVTTGEDIRYPLLLTESGRFSLESATTDWPPKAWGVPFPVLPGSLEDCLAAP